MGMMDYGGFGMGWGLFGSIFMVLFWVAVVLLIIWLYRQVRGQQASAQIESALEILKKRYVNGEITKEEFERMKRDLS